MKNMIKKALMEGMSLEAILDTVEEARGEVENAMNLDAYREDMILSVLDYLRALGVIPNEVVFSDEEIESAVKAVKDAEKEIKEQTAVLKALMPMAMLKPKSKSKKTDADTAIKDWKNWLDTL